MTNNNKFLLASIVMIILVIATWYFYSRRIRKHPILQRIQATADIKAQVYETPGDKTVLTPTNEYVNIKKGEIVGYLYLMKGTDYYTIRNKKGIIIPMASGRKIL